MNKEDHIILFSRLRILEKIVDTVYPVDIRGMYAQLIFLYSILIENRFVFDVKTVTYEELIEFESELPKKVIKPLNKGFVKGLLIWLKKYMNLNMTSNQNMKVSLYYFQTLS